MGREEQVDAFLEASVRGWTGRAGRLLAAAPEIAGFDLTTAAVVGDHERVAVELERDPGAAGRPDRRRGWPPLAYACRSVWHHVGAVHALGLAEVVRRLLAAGADPDDGGAGAGDLLTHVAGHRQRECLRLLLEAGATIPGSGALAAAITADDLRAVHLLLDAGADPGDGTPPPLPHAIAAGAGLPVIEALLDAGADPDAPGRDGRSPMRLAVRRGRPEVVRSLLHHAAHDDATDVDRFIGACTHADRAAVGHALERNPRLRDEMTDEDRWAIVDAADHAGSHAVEVMLEFGFRLDARRDDGATPLHAAAYAGRINLVRRLAERGADLDARDSRHGHTPLTWAILGSQERPAYNPDGDWLGTVRTLLDAGASIDGIEVPPAPDDVAALLAAQGVGAGRSTSGYGGAA
jgi:ankyrin repeat protein